MARPQAHDRRKNSGDFSLPVDSEHKAAVFRPWTFRGVHMTAFHASWLSFFICFLSTFAPAALIPVIREDLDLDTRDMGESGIAAVTGVISARIVMGALCDTIGPRFGHAGLTLLTAPAVFGMALINEPLGFILLRFLIGFSLATFVACQYWSSVMFNVKIVGNANATGAGWGNSGGGASQLLMPIIFKAFEQSYEPFLAWRLAFFIPGSLHIIIGFVVLFFAQDMPDGSFYYLRSRGDIAKASVRKALMAGMHNWRTWMLAWLYGFSFGVELTINNIVVAYFFDNFDVSLRVAGVFASVFGLLNIFARSIGGFTSDSIANDYGMRGRLATFWLVQTVEGLLCLSVGLVSNSLTLTVVMLGVFSIFVQASEGACFGIVPFVSKRALGVVTGFIGAGGNIGSVILQSVFFRTGSIEVDTGFIFMGITVVAMTQLVHTLYFPQWGGIFFSPQANYTEEDYYLSEYTEDEIAQGMANASLVFAVEAQSQRGAKRLKLEDRMKEKAASTKSGVSASASTSMDLEITKIRVDGGRREHMERYGFP